MVVLILACSEPAAVDGQAIDARTGAALGDFALALTASGCVPVDLRTDAEGRWSAKGGCDWEIRPEEGWTAGADGRFWRAPPTDGVYLLGDRDATWLPTNTALDTERVLDGEREVRYPEAVPGALPLVTGDAVLLFAGVDLALEPLVPSERRTFGTSALPRPIDPWMYLGVAFTDDTTLIDVDVTPACTVADVDRTLRYCAAGAVPAGRYVLVAGERGIVIDFG